MTDGKRKRSEAAQEPKSDEAVQAKADRDDRDAKRRELLVTIRQAYEEEDKAFEALGWALQVKSGSDEGRWLWEAALAYFAKRAEISRQKVTQLLEMGDG